MALAYIGSTAPGGFSNISQYIFKMSSKKTKNIPNNPTRRSARLAQAAEREREDTGLGLFAENRPKQPGPSTPGPPTPGPSTSREDTSQSGHEQPSSSDSLERAEKPNADPDKAIFRQRRQRLSRPVRPQSTERGPASFAPPPGSSSRSKRARSQTPDSEEQRLSAHPRTGGLRLPAKYRRANHWGWDSLPGEVKSQTLSYVPAADLLNHVQNDSFMKPAIVANERWIADHIIMRRRPELQELFASYDYTTYDSLFDALKHWIFNKGFWVMPLAPLYNYDFVYQFGPGRKASWYDDVEEYVNLLIDLHLACHEPTDFPHSKGIERLIDAARRFSVPGTAMANRTEGPDDIDRIVAGELDPPHPTWCFDLGSISRGMLPFAPLTDCFWREEEVSGALNDGHALIRALGLSSFPVVGRPPYVGRRVGYVCQEKDLPMFVELEHQLVDLSIPLMPLQKANLLEKLNIW